jgi:hypothetical protein
MVGLLGRVISPSQGLYLYRTTQHRKTRTNIHALSGIRTHDPSNQSAKTHASDLTATDSPIILLYVIWDIDSVVKKSLLSKYLVVYDVFRVYMKQLLPTQSLPSRPMLSLHWRFGTQFSYTQLLIMIPHIKSSAASLLCCDRQVLMFHLLIT